ncbi:dTDP-4-dehydrorhamnose 3,5-epimerase [Nonomuraea sp. NPDC049158]|uniref:dTDP-4-dehydrorhamnose 3,5-epimerase family protein n=1 Tax=Nonomuraea sp. NPDC049158 TaxID=3155649 RepID=UPI003400A60E
MTSVTSMTTRPLAVPGAWAFDPVHHRDPRGRLVVWYDEQALAAATGHPLRLGQTNHAVSRKDTLRGVHLTRLPPGQGKYVYCPRGSALDVVVDLRPGSPTFGLWDALLLSESNCRAVYISEGLGHAYWAYEDDTTIVYLCSERYDADKEVAVHPLDPALALPWPEGRSPVLSERDARAPSLGEAERADLLPGFAACLEHYARLRTDAASSGSPSARLA